MPALGPLRRAWRRPGDRDALRGHSWLLVDRWPRRRWRYGPWMGDASRARRQHGHPVRRRSQLTLSGVAAPRMQPVLPRDSETANGRATAIYGGRHDDWGSQVHVGWVAITVGHAIRRVAVAIVPVAIIACIRVVSVSANGVGDDGTPVASRGHRGFLRCGMETRSKCEGAKSRSRVPAEFRDSLLHVPSFQIALPVTPWAPQCRISQPFNPCANSGPKPRRTRCCSFHHA